MLVRVQDGQAHKFADLVSVVGKDLGLTAEDIEHLLPSGRQGMFRNRLHWASFYLLKAGLLNRPKRAWLQVTTPGAEALRLPEAINTKYLQRFEEFREFQKAGSQIDESGGTETPPAVDTRTPEELLDKG